jgi:tRNA U34 5-carboxymethylaminomethyl modifying GTPase MnmE/TrmE|tara:strand:- start:567 stop:827 length:261 start_codon:yes stop_codon:yes gene_type:complete
MSDDFWTIEDFGFTAVNENELEVAQKASSAASTATVNEEKLKKLHNAIKPLLANLKQNPDKEYILWPNRVQVIEKFESHLADIVYK